MEFIIVVGIVQAFFIEFILLNKKNKTISDRVLAVWMFFMGLHLFLYYLDLSGYLLDYPHLIGVSLGFPLIHGPFLFLYVSVLIRPEPQLHKLDYLHFTPMIACYLLMVPQFLYSTSRLNDHIDQIEAGLIHPLYMSVLIVWVPLSGVVYVLWSLLKLRKHKRSLGDHFSHRQSVDLIWLRNLILGMAVIWTAVILTDFTVAGSTLLQDYSGYVIYGTLVIFVFLIGYFGIRQGRIFTDNKEPAVAHHEQEVRSKYEKSSLKKDQAATYVNRLLQFMDEEKPHREPKITLPEIAGRLQIQNNKLSQVINENLEKNFYDFINEYRLEEFKQRVKADKEKRITLLGHALASGFSSKSSFNQVFRKSTGQTPSQYFKDQVRV